MLLEDLGRVGVAREDHQRHRLEVGVLLDLLAHQEAVHARQLDGEEDQVRLVRSRPLEPRASVRDHFERDIASFEAIA